MSARDLTGVQLAEALGTFRSYDPALIEYLDEAARRLGGTDEISEGTVRAERARQDQKWGGADHDDRHSGDEWRRFLLDHARKGNLLEVAALGYAVTEVLDRLRKRMIHADEVLRGLK